ncbi:hypothetical protein ACFWNF_16180 [Streptomyces anulatus]|uniref:hypothetical protein n=1 Tax=Streptomyces anulatus TaxID=1892 RepID=UPI00365C6F3A
MPTSPTPAADRPADQLRARLRAAAQRALESLDSLIADHQDPGAEALGARYELARELSNTSPEVARQLLGTTETAAPSVDEQELVQLRWGLDDVMYGDDDTTTVLLSGPGREPYWVELDPERTAALRAALAGPAAPPALNDSDRQFLTFALELAADQMAARGDEFDDEDEAALVKFRALATPPAAPAAPEEPTR